MGERGRGTILSPRAVTFIMKSTGATMPVRGSGKGQGKAQAAQ